MNTIPKITVDLPELPHLRLTLTNVPAIYGILRMTTLTQIKFYVQSETTVSFSKTGGLLAHGANGDAHLVLWAGQELRLSDYISCSAVVAKDGSFRSLGEQITPDEVFLAFASEQYYEKNVAEGLQFAALADYEVSFEAES
jgi:hypothetical protein